MEYHGLPILGRYIYQLPGIFNTPALQGGYQALIAKRQLHKLQIKLNFRDIFLERRFFAYLLPKAFNISLMPRVRFNKSIELIPRSENGLKQSCQRRFQSSSFIEDILLPRILLQMLHNYFQLL